jgi:cobalt-zinc-cadmium efflux system protein
MPHHHHSPSAKPDSGVRKRLWVAFLLNFFFTIIEFIGGLYTNSMAILSDAVHDMGDTIAIGGAHWLEKVAERGRDNRYTYGYKRFSTLGALITSVILLAGCIIIVYEAIPRLIEPQEVMAMGMFWMAILGIVFNGIAVLRLRGGNDSLNNRAVMLHLMEDVVGWIAVLIGSLVIKFTGWYWVDPLLSLAVAGYILYNVILNLRAILSVFLQTTPPGFNLEVLTKELRNIESVSDVHDVHTWSLDGNYHVLSLHLVVNDAVSRDRLIEIRAEANKIVRDYDIDHPTIALEFEGEECDGCYQ